MASADPSWLRTAHTRASTRGLGLELLPDVRDVTLTVPTERSRGEHVALAFFEQGGHHVLLGVEDNEYRHPGVGVTLRQKIGGQAESASRTGTIITLADTNVVTACDSGKGGEHV